MSGKLTPGEIAFGAALGIPAALLTYVRLKYPTVWKDIRAIQISKRQAAICQEMEANSLTIVDVFERQVINRSHKPFILYEDASFTYQDVDRETNKLARFIQHCGALKMRDTVAFFIHNEPAFLWSYLGFNKLGIAAALVNINLRLQSLLHCITICGAKAVICGKGKLLNLKNRHITSPPYISDFQTLQYLQFLFSLFRSFSII